MRSIRALAALACLALAVEMIMAGCGDGSDSSGDGSATSVESRPAPPKSAFPNAKELSLSEVLEAGDAKPSTLVVSPAAQTFFRGENRYPFGVFERDGRQVADAEVALYFAKVPEAKGVGSTQGGVSPGAAQAKRRVESRALDEAAIGPFPAAIESLQTKPAFRAQTTTTDPDAATVVYTTQIDFPSDGEWRIAALIRKDGELSAALLPSADVGAFAGVPRVGEKAPLIHTPTPEDTGGDLAQI